MPAVARSVVLLSTHGERSAPRSHLNTAVPVPPPMCVSFPRRGVGRGDSPARAFPSFSRPSGVLCIEAMSVCLSDFRANLFFE